MIAALRRLRPDLDLDGYTRLAELVERLTGDRAADGVDRRLRPDEQ